MKHQRSEQTLPVPCPYVISRVHCIAGKTNWPVLLINKETVQPNL